MAVAGTLKVMGKKPAGPGAGGAVAGGPAGGRGGSGGPGGRGALVAATQITQRIFTDRLDVQGVAKGRQSVTLTATGGQVVDKVMFKSGDRVKKGQVLLQLRRDAEDAGIAQAQAAVDLAKSTADRWNKLAAQGLAPAATAEQYQSAYITSQTSLDAAKARLQDRVISAPFSGVVGLSDIAPGALISPGTAIVTLDDTDVIIVDIDVPDRNLALVKEGVAIDATSDSYPGEHYAGRIAKIDTRIDERSRSFKARAELPNPGNRLKPGMLLHVGIDRGTHQGLAAPEAAVQYSAGQASVFMIVSRGGGPTPAATPAAQPAAGAPAGAPAGRPASGGLIAQQRPIVAGIDECGFIEVKDGLTLGDRIVADGLNKLTPNQAISLGGRGGPGARSGAGGAPASAKPASDKVAVAPQAGARGPGQGKAGPGVDGPSEPGGLKPAVAHGGNGENCSAKQPMGHGGADGAQGPGGQGRRGAGAAGMPPAGARGPGRPGRGDEAIQ
jgi:membrane fusion protein (multidrug efflux system)